jgi:hypothetical protein
MRFSLIYVYGLLHPGKSHTQNGRSDSTRRILTLLLKLEASAPRIIAKARNTITLEAPIFSVSKLELN